MSTGRTFDNNERLNDQFTIQHLVGKSRAGELCYAVKCEKCGVGNQTFTARQLQLVESLHCKNSTCGKTIKSNVVNRHGRITYDLTPQAPVRNRQEHIDFIMQEWAKATPGFSFKEHFKHLVYYTNVLHHGELPINNATLDRAFAWVKEQLQGR